jgi:hypothetical protein
VQSRAFPCLRALYPVFFFGVFGCSGGTHPHGPPPLPNAVVLRFDHVVVSPTKPGTTDRWDGREAENAGTGCALVELGVSWAASPMAGSAAGIACKALTPSPENERAPEDPDLELRVSAGTGAIYASHSTRDVTQETFRYELTVPSAAIPQDGLRVEVVDLDANATPQVIGSVRLLRADISRALAHPQRTLVLSTETIRKLEIVASEYTPARLASASVPARDGLHRVGTRSIFAGEIVKLSANGHYTVGTWYDDPIGPMGYHSQQARGYNLKREPFQSAPHACAVATIDDLDKLHGELVRPARTFVARVAGPLRLGLNDNDPTNNHGVVAFEGSTRAPTAEEWLRQEAVGVN